jgi:hypothetical protein
MDIVCKILVGAAMSIWADSWLDPATSQIAGGPVRHTENLEQMEFTPTTNRNDKAIRAKPSGKQGVYL